jgi:hypothetical protein
MQIDDVLVTLSVISAVILRDIGSGFITLRPAKARHPFAFPLAEKRRTADEP